jgi:hypothetical protein
VLGSSGAYTVSHGSSMDTRGNFAQAATKQERLNLITMHIAALTAMKNAIADLQPQL